MKDFLKAYTRYAQFGGRSDRKEFWYYVLFYVIVSAILSMLDVMLFGGAYHYTADGWDVSYDRGILSGIFWLVSIVPWIAVQVRRLHDTNKSGWLVLLWWIPIIGWILLLIWYCQKGDPAPNAHGEPPEGSVAA
jgi:uncharacterized membrane protein YhaH (DUF805 family)